MAEEDPLDISSGPSPTPAPTALLSHFDPLELPEEDQDDVEFLHSPSPSPSPSPSHVESAIANPFYDSTSEDSSSSIPEEGRKSTELCSKIVEGKSVSQSVCLVYLLTLIEVETYESRSSGENHNKCVLTLIACS